tara:strand:+ start:1990 stop:2613 length:624 start_codon:yes stop_codon:yes gene_type:complete
MSENDKENRRIYNREYHAKNKKRLNKKSREYYEKNKDEINRKIRERRKKDSEFKRKDNERSKNYRNAHIEELNKKNKEYYEEHKEEILPKNRERYNKNKTRYNSTKKVYHKKRKKTRREQVYLHYGNGKIECSCCGESNIEFMNLHHKNNDGNEYKKKFGRVNLIDWALRFNLPPIFELLCSNCNIGKEKSPDKICPHKWNIIQEEI